jgi:hypothetical protein
MAGNIFNTPHTHHKIVSKTEYREESKKDIIFKIPVLLEW